MTKAKKKQLRYDIAYMRMAMEWAQLSHCDRKKVGALIVKDRMIISDGYNGTPTGFENECEDEDHYTKWYVLHAEANAIMKWRLHRSLAQEQRSISRFHRVKNVVNLFIKRGLNA